MPCLAPQQVLDRRVYATYVTERMRSHGRALVRQARRHHADTQRHCAQKEPRQSKFFRQQFKYKYYHTRLIYGQSHAKQHRLDLGKLNHHAL